MFSHNILYYLQSKLQIKHKPSFVCILNNNNNNKQHHGGDSNYTLSSIHKPTTKNSKHYVSRKDKITSPEAAEDQELQNLKSPSSSSSMSAGDNPHKALIKNKNKSYIYIQYIPYTNIHLFGAIY